MQLTVNKQTFVDNFLYPLTNLVGEGMVYFEHDKDSKSLISICQHSNQTLACCSRYFYEQFDAPADFALRDIRRLIKAIEFTDKQQTDLTLVFDRDLVYYEDSTMKFEITVMDESMARQFRIGLNPVQFDKFDFQIEFQIAKAAIKQLVKARQFVQEADAIRISQDSKGQVFCELYKHKAPKCDKVKLKVADQSSGKFKQDWSVPIDLITVIDCHDSDMRVLSKFDRGNFLLSADLNDCNVKYGQVPIS